MQHYEHLIKPLSIGAMGKVKPVKKPGAYLTIPEYKDQTVWLHGSDLEGMKLNFSWSFKTKLGEWHPGMDPHTHPYAEIIAFVGLDSANVNQLGADMDVCLGEEQEIYPFSESTAFVIPAGLPHGPIKTKRIYSPKGIGCLIVSLSPTTEAAWMGEEAANLTAAQWKKKSSDNIKMHAAKKIINSKSIAETGKYEHLIKTLRDYQITQRGKPTAAAPAPKAGSAMKLGPGNADNLVWLYGKDLEGMRINMDWGFYSKPGLWHRGVGAHAHDVDEILVFAGIDPADINNLGAEIEVDLGKEHEHYIINQPSVVVLPAGTPHTPIITRWADKPFAFFSINLAGAYKTVLVD